MASYFSCVEESVQERYRIILLHSVFICWLALQVHIYAWVISEISAISAPGLFLAHLLALFIASRWQRNFCIWIHDHLRAAAKFS